jgi:hypothetical protein
MAVPASFGEAFRQMKRASNDSGPAAKYARSEFSEYSRSEDSDSVMSAEPATQEAGETLNPAGADILHDFNMMFSASYRAAKGAELPSFSAM